MLKNWDFPKISLFTLFVLGFLSLAFSSSAYTIDDFQKIYFLHHSTGNGVYSYPSKGVPAWFSDYNSAHSTNFQISHRYYPNSPYPWANYPYDYWNLWINGACTNSDPDMVCMDYLTQNYDVIIYKHCYPSSDILADTGSPDLGSSRKSIENYKLQYRALRDLMDSYPDNIFIMWTLPPRRESETNAANALRATQFSEWMKTEFLTEDGNEHPNIYIFDFRDIVMGPDNFLADGYVGDSSSHPNDAANNAAGPQFSQFIVDSIYDFVSQPQGPCDDGVCDAGDNCPLLNNTCSDNSCYEPECSNGCQETPVSFGEQDESCSGNNVCDGVGNCIPCQVGIDQDCNNVVDNSELFSCINDWFNNAFSISELMQSIRYWKRGYI